MNDNDQIFELMTKLYNEMNDIKSEVKDIKSGVNDIKSEFKEVKSEVKDIQMTLENETNKNIKIIAEGHFNLNHKLDDALRVENEKELLLIRVTSLENEVRRLKARIEEIA